jgi:hypothetical protein
VKPPDCPCGHLSSHTPSFSYVFFSLLLLLLLFASMAFMPMKKPRGSKTSPQYVDDTDTHALPRWEGGGTTTGTDSTPTTLTTAARRARERKKDNNTTQNKKKKQKSLGKKSTGTVFACPHTPNNDNREKQHSTSLKTTREAESTPNCLQCDGVLLLPPPLFSLFVCECR